MLLPTVQGSREVVVNIAIVRNPSDDPEFERAISQVISEGVRDPSEAQDRLRKRYPHVIVRPRALTGEPIPVWYVYREGRWTAAGAGSEERHG